MVARFQVKFDDREVKRMMRRLGPAAKRAASRGLNRTATQVKTESGRVIRDQERNLKAGVVNKALKTIPSNATTLTAKIRATGLPIPLRDFKGTKFLKGRGKARVGRGVYVQVVPGKRKLIKGAFVLNDATRKGSPHDFSGHIFRRRGKARLHIDKLLGPSIPTGFVKRSVEIAMKRKAAEKGPKLIEDQLLFEIKKVSG